MSGAPDSAWLGWCWAVASALAALLLGQGVGLWRARGQVIMLDLSALAGFGCF